MASFSLIQDLSGTLKSPGATEEQVPVSPRQLQQFEGVLIPSMKLEGASSSGRGCVSMEKIR